MQLAKSALKLIVVIMNKETRIKNIEKEIQKKNPIGRQEIPWEDDLVPMDVFKIPLQCLIYNKYNGRILSRTKSLEKQHRNIDPESEEGKEKIETLLWNSKIDRNKKTQESIDRHGQQKPGIVTRDGIIIDGNRRAMLLARSGKKSFFKAVVLPVTLEENPLGIEELETTYQMGEDEKLGYNPIEKYLKAKGLYQSLAHKTFRSKDEKNHDLVAINKISDWMGEDKRIIKEYLQVMETMDDYLSYLSYDGIYTQLDGREDQFINLTQWVNRYLGEESTYAFSGYRNDDVDDLRTIGYDFIRLKYEGKKFRYLAKGQRQNHFFGTKEIWADFRDRHFSCTEKVIEEPIDLNSQNLEAHLNDRDGKYKSRVFDEFDENVDFHAQALRYRKAEDEPSKLIGNAKRALESINQHHKSFSTPEVAAELEKVNEFVNSMLSNSSPIKTLSHALKILNSVNLKNHTDEKDELIEKATEIQKKAYKLTKKIKKLH